MSVNPTEWLQAMVALPVDLLSDTAVAGEGFFGMVCFFFFLKLSFSALAEYSTHSEESICRFHGGRY